VSGGLTSYPRTGGGGGSSLARINRLLRQLQSGTLTANEAIAGLIILSLEAYAKERAEVRAFSDVVTVAVRVREALFLERVNGKLAGPFFLRAMEICADAFKRYRPLESTGFASRSKAAVTGARQSGVVPAVLRGFKEEVGLVAWLYETSALLGVDLSQHVAANATSLGNRFVASRSTPSGRLSYLESGSAYNINVLVCVEISGCDLPLVIAGEAKGGASGYGEVKTPKDMFRVLSIRPPVKQSTLDYARTRAVYMKNEQGSAPWQRARREAGVLIDAAATTETLVFVAARGDVAGATQMTRREYLECT
jgi:hypothetical protein